jgi:hypothetical protein
VASYEETLVSISLDADASIAVDTSPPYLDKADPDGGTKNAGFQYRFVQVTGDHQVGLFTAGSGERAVGVLQSKPQNVGMAATVAVLGISLLESGGAFDAGAAIGSDATGRAVAGGDLGISIYGAEAAGVLVPVLLRSSTTAAA